MRRKEVTYLGALMAPLLLLVGAPQEAASQVRPSTGLEGTWTGDFGAGNWTFKFAPSNKSWDGRYTYPQYKGWNPLMGLAVNGKSVRFSLKAKTAVDFNLRLDSNNALSGTVQFAHGMTATSAPVVLPVTLKRM